MLRVKRTGPNQGKGLKETQIADYQVDEQGSWVALWRWTVDPASLSVDEPSEELYSMEMTIAGGWVERPRPASVQGWSRGPLYWYPPLIGS